ncbi:MAG: glycosyltransferase family 1 protein [Caldilinea sp. CFX5]|nr:glycosyltransferase family 1 protein [Caldilinea sp. CFX5]
MIFTCLIVLKQSFQSYAPQKDCAVVDSTVINGWIRQGTIIRHLLRYGEVQGRTYHLAVVTKPFAFALLLRLLSRGRCYIIDEYENTQTVTLRTLLQFGKILIQDFLQKNKLLRKISEDVEQLHHTPGASNLVALDLKKRPVYLRTDLLFGLKSGGSIGHIAGVLNHLDEFSGHPIFISTDRILTVRNDIEYLQVWPDCSFRDYRELHLLAFNHTFYERALSYLENKELGFIYQRYSLYNFAGIKLAQKLQLPFVIEYNGSEIWMSRHWGKRLAYETIAEQIEMANLQSAHLVVVVSQPMKDELIARGIDGDKILVNPNGVDVTRYSPEVASEPIRRLYGLTEKIVIGFIGTFGPWHGAEVLAEAFGSLLQSYPIYRDKVRLLMIGDGVALPKAKANLANYSAAENVIFTGLIPQEQGPAHLAACDILVSPHVPNPDGSPFFGSPTKLFEYMAMGKGIVASNLDQIGQVLSHNHTAWMVKPGDVAALATGLKMLIDNPDLRAQLGQNARTEVVRNYTWRAHTQHIIEKLIELC